MKKILWITNIPIPKIATILEIPVQNICGWITGFANEVEQQEDIELFIAFPLLGEKEILSRVVGNIKYYCFYQRNL